MQTRVLVSATQRYRISGRIAPGPGRGSSAQNFSRTAKHIWAGVTLCCFMALLVPGRLQAQDQVGAEPPAKNEPILRLEKAQARIDLIETFTKVIELKPQIRFVDGYDPNVIQVSAISPHQIRLQALTQGVTQLALTDENDKTYTIEVFVEGDVRHLQAMIDRLFPDSAVKAIKVGTESVVLRGFVAKPEQITRIVDVAEQFFPVVINQMDFGGEQQIKLKIIVMEVQRAKLRQFGFNFLLLGENGYFASTPGQLTPLASLTTAAGAAPSAAVRASALADSTLTFGVVRPDAIFSGFLEALKKESLLKIYSNTELVASNGRPANLLAGGEFPILVPQSLGTVSVEYRPFGTSLEAVPILLGNGRLRLELQPEVSETDFANAVTLSGTTVPAITTRRVNTQVEMNFGQTLVIAGLLSNRDKAETHKVPFLGELPYVGAAFRREQYDEGETEVVVMVTPEVVGPLASEEVPPGGPGRFTTTPTDRELYLDGMIEVPSYGDMCSGCTLGCEQCVGGHHHGTVKHAAPPMEYAPSNDTILQPVPGGMIMPGPGMSPAPMPAPGPTYVPPAEPRLQEVPPARQQFETELEPQVRRPSAQLPYQNAQSQYSPSQNLPTQNTQWRAAPRTNTLIQPNTGTIQPVSGMAPQPATSTARPQRTVNGLISPSGK